MFWEVGKRKSGIEMENQGQCPYHGRVEALEQAVEKINSTCCSMNHVEQRVKTNILLEQLATKIDGMNNKLATTEETLEKYKNYLHIVLGILVAVQFFGLDAKIKSMVMGG